MKTLVITKFEVMIKWKISFDIICHLVYAIILIFLIFFIIQFKCQIILNTISIKCEMNYEEENEEMREDYY